MTKEYIEREEALSAIKQAFEKFKEVVHNEMEADVNDMLCEEFGKIATVKVTKTFADLYRTERRC